MGLPTAGPRRAPGLVRRARSVSAPRKVGPAVDNPRRGFVRADKSVDLRLMETWWDLALFRQPHRRTVVEKHRTESATATWR